VLIGADINGNGDMLAGVQPILRDRLFKPSDCPYVRQWIDFRDPETMTFDSGSPGDRYRTFNRIEDKSGHGNALRNWVGQKYSPHYDALLRRLYSNNSQSSAGKVLRSHNGNNYYFLRGAEGWGYFVAYGFTNTSASRRLFDAIHPNVLFSAWNGGQGGIHINGNPRRLRPYTNDTAIHVWSARRLANGQLIQDWDATTRAAWSSSWGGDISMSVNWGRYRGSEHSRYFQIFSIIATAGDLPLDDYETLRAYTAWHADQPHRLPDNHPWRHRPPTA